VTRQTDVAAGRAGHQAALTAEFLAGSRRAVESLALAVDELEAIGGSRQQIRGRPGQTLVSQLLAEMDGVAGRNDRLLVMGATAQLLDVPSLTWLLGVYL